MHSYPGVIPITEKSRNPTKNIAVPLVDSRSSCFPQKFLGHQVEQRRGA
jgi:hypothetical protein